MITKLTLEQKARFPELANRWIKIGLSVEPADRPRAEAAIRKCYEIAGKNAPERIVWCGSPLAQGLTCAIVFKATDVVRASVGESVWASVRASVGESVWASVGASVWESVGASVGASVGESVRASVGASVRASVRASVWESVRASVWESVGASVVASVGESVRASVWESVWESVRASVGASVGESVRASVWESVWESVRASVVASVGASVVASVGESVRASVWASVWESGYGQHDASWLAFYDFFREVCGLDQKTLTLCGLWDLGQSAGWWLPYEKICWISERPCNLNRDESGRLHSEDGPALSYPDGWSIWAIDGVRIDEQIVMRPESQTAQQIRGEQNEEIKRIRIERFAGRDRSSADGWQRYLRKANARVIHQRDNAVENTKEALVRTPDGLTTLVCACPSTARVYALEVPKETERCESAQQFLWSGSRLAERTRINIIGRS